MRKEKNTHLGISILVTVLLVLLAVQLLTIQINKYEGMSINEVIEKRYGSQLPYLQSENYFIVINEPNGYEIFYVDDLGQNIKIKKSGKYFLVKSTHILYDEIIKRDEDIVFNIQYDGSEKEVTIYDSNGEWESVTTEGSIYFFKVLKNIQSDYIAYIDYGDGVVEEIVGDNIINGFN